MNDDDKNSDTMMDLQTRLITEDALSDALFVQHDEEQPVDSNTRTIQLDIQVMDEVPQKGEKQPNRFRDAPFGFLFIIHIGLILFFAFAWGLPALFATTKDDNKNGNHENDTSVSGVVGLMLLSSLASVFIISGSLTFMISHADILVPFVLILAPCVSAVMGVAFLIKGFTAFACIYLLLAATGVCYAWSVWNRVPFARANLKVATTAIKTNQGVIGVGFGLIGVFLVWSCMWMISFLGIYMRSRTCDDKGECDEGALGQITGILYLLSFFWTTQVIKNILVATVAGTVGTWWFAPQEANSFCSVAIMDSFSRASTFSFGSICLGSLLVAIIQVLHHLIQNARMNQRDSFLLCVLECLADLLERAAEYFNKYACIYVGLYGYDYMMAGRRVLELFRQRGWDTILNDQLVYRVLVLMSVVVGGLTGCTGMLLASLLPNSWMEVFGDGKYTAAFLLPFLIGTAMANVVLGIVASATDTVMVCFAESPNEFQANYPNLSQEMILAWRQIYPEEFGF